VYSTTSQQSMQILNPSMAQWRQSPHDPNASPKPHLWMLLALGTKPWIQDLLGRTSYPNHKSTTQTLL
jgi:hypothetical protein